MKPEDYTEYVRANCPRLYGRQVMLYLFKPDFRAAVVEGDEERVGELLVEYLGHRPTGGGLAACDEWERHLGGGK